MLESDRQEVERYYQTLSTWIRLHGAEHLGTRYVVVRLARMEVMGPLDFSDIQRILGQVVDLRSWYDAWHAEAARAEAMADRFVAEGRTVSAGDMLHRASMCHHWGQYLARVGSQQKAEGRAGRVRCYRRAVDLLDARDELVSVEEGRQMAGGPLGEFVNFEDGFHTCTNYNATLVPLMCDWMSDRLQRKGRSDGDS